MVAYIIDVRHDHQGHAPLVVETFGESRVKPRAVHHQIALRPLLVCVRDVKRICEGQAVRNRCKGRIQLSVFLGTCEV